MILRFISFLFLSFLDFVAALSECSYAEFIPTTVMELSDLRGATPFTYGDPISAFNCSSVTPSTVTQAQPYTPLTSWYTAIVNGTSFPCQSSFIWSTVITQTTTIYISYTFPGLTVTSLTPGESIEMSYQVYPVTGFTADIFTGYYYIFVPTDAITLTPTSIPNPKSSPSPVPIGAITGGAIGGVVVLGAIFGIAWYKISTHRKLNDTEPAVNIQFNEGPEGDSPYNHPSEKSGVDDTRLRYPTDLASGNISTANY